MTAIATLSGRVIDFLAPDPGQILLDDIRIGVQRHPRYTGQTTREYSVAQHCLLVASLVAPEHKLHALLHDAPEGYVCDVSSPMKEAMRAIARLTGHQSPYDVIEHGIWKAICRRYDISPELPPEVTQADHLAMLIEAPVLQPRGWEQAVWNFAREEEREVSGAHRGELLRVLALDNRGGIDWMLAVNDELARRRA